jgi:citrate lyase subunit beta/citryl-CoA lyase
MVARSYLFVPATRPDRFEKAIQSGADAVIIDLEDAVPTQSKAEARAGLAKWLSPNHPVYVRINAQETEWYKDDVSAVVREGLRGLLLPKSEDPTQVAELAAGLPDSVALIPVVETAQGIWNSHELARCPKVERLGFGNLDFQRDLRILGNGIELLYTRSHLVLVSRLANLLPPIDGVTTALEDTNILLQDIEQARRLGFGGKLCIHPRQVEMVNRGFLPSEQEIAWARRVLEAAEAGAGAAVRLDSEMIDVPVIQRARQILATGQEVHAKD